MELNRLNDKKTNLQNERKRLNGRNYMKQQNMVEGQRVLMEWKNRLIQQIDLHFNRLADMLRREIEGEGNVVGETDLNRLEQNRNRLNQRVDKMLEDINRQEERIKGPDFIKQLLDILMEQ